MNDEELALIEELGSFAYDPLGFVLWAFPWGEPGELANFTGPAKWQVEILTKLRDGLLSVDQAIRLATKSGHGIGKSALVSWITWWAYSTFPGTRGVVTANTENQLKTKTWVEIAKWHRLFIASHLFKCTATALFTVDETTSREWRIDIVPWSERNTEAFAGLHNQGKRILIIFDEASAIPDIIWETTEGALTDRGTEIIWAVFGNPTRNNGRFRECFDGGKFAARWANITVDSREVPYTNHEQIAIWIEDYGLDSDFVKVRVLGLFPTTDAQSFISYENAVAATKRDIEPQGTYPVILGVDVARFGDDASIIYPRQGRDARSRPPEIYRGLSTVQLASRVMQAMNRYNAVVAMVDGGGVGGGVVDQLRSLGVYVIEVQFGAAPDGTNTYSPGVGYANKRAEIWGELRDFINNHGAIVEHVPGNEASLPAELAGPAYTLNSKQKIQLESKEMMKARGQPSPNIADALACTFAMPMPMNLPAGFASARPQLIPDYNPFSSESIYEST